MMKTILIRPNVKRECYQGLADEFTAIEPPLWLLMRAQNLMIQGDEVEVVDLEVMDLDIGELEADSFEIVLYGANPSSFVQQGSSLAELGEKLHGDFKVWWTCPAFNLNILPMWDSVDLSNYRAHTWHCLDGEPRSPYGVFHTAYGCPFSCDFCTSNQYHRGVYYERPLDNVLTDIGALVEKHSVKKLKVIDDMFFLKRSRVEDLCDRIISKQFDLDIWAYARVDTIDLRILPKLKKAGFNWIALGIESGSRVIRSSVSKGTFSNDRVREVVRRLKENGINVLGNFMFGFKDDTLHTMNETLALALDLNCEHVNFYSKMDFPSGDKPIRSWSSYAQYSYDCVPAGGGYLSSAEILSFRDNAFQQYFTNSDYLHMIREKFGEQAVEGIKKITAVPLRRKLYGNRVEQKVEV